MVSLTEVYIHAMSGAAAGELMALYRLVGTLMVKCIHLLTRATFDVAGC